MGAPIGILAEACYLPPTTKSIDAVFRDEDVPDDPLPGGVDFRRDIGIRSIRVADGETASGLAVEASRRAVERAGIDPEEIDLVVGFTSIAEDHVAPTWSAAGVVQREVGATRAFATSVNTGGCASFHATMKAACSMLAASDEMDTALLFAGDKAPRLNHAYYPVTVVCDGGSAVVLRKGHDRRVVLAVETATVGKLHDVLYAPGFPHRDPSDPCRDRWLHMTGDYRRFGEEVVPVNLFMFRRVMRAAMKRAGVGPDDIDVYIYPTFSAWDQRAFCEGLGIPPEKVYTRGLADHGHLQETDMVLNHVDAEEDGTIGDGDLVMLTTNGAGFAWGATIVRQ
ncbi:MAG TPA: 3-oxoacyl-[acyl-carrier-protein] synthase III C-terminal domain-containing protein [Acidimicrobiales bacterium]|jgi:3-oxoacyl-[acyl-carrier-protein] synthase-3